MMRSLLNTPCNNWLDEVVAAVSVAPYYRDDAVVIFNADCREIVPHIPKAHLLLTDPPYGIGKDGQKRTTGGHGGRKAYDFKGWDADRPAPWVLMMLLDHLDVGQMMSGTQEHSKEPETCLN